MRLILAMLFMCYTGAASELDNESAVTNKKIEASKALPSTVVVRVNTNTKEVEILHSSELLAPNSESIKAIEKRDFAKAKLNEPTVGELDREGSRSSWLFYFGLNPFFYGGYTYPNYYYSPYYYQPSYYYGGYNYSYYPYYSNNYGPYYYNYYRWWF